MLLIKLPVKIRTNLFLNYTDKFYYPYLYDFKNSDVDQRINYSIYRDMVKLIGELKQPGLVTYVSGSYEIKTNQRNILSASLIGLGDFKGAHPVTIIKSLTFDINNGKLYKFSELFKNDSNYLEIISDIVYESLKKRGYDLFEGYKGVTKDQDYYVVDNNLIVYFQQATIAPYSNGFPYVSIPIYEIDDLIRQNGILERMIGIS